MAGKSPQQRYAQEVGVSTPSSAAQQQARTALKAWQQAVRRDPFSANPDFQHSVRFYFPHDWPARFDRYRTFATLISERLEALCALNDERNNLPRLEPCNAFGEPLDQVRHHPAYQAIGELIYSSGLLAGMATAGGLLDALGLFYLSCHLGEAGHNCPIACSAGLIRLLRRLPDVADRDELLRKLSIPTFGDNFSSAQFLTEIQGGSDVGSNSCQALRDARQQWRIHGEKWFCSNPEAELILLTARPEPSQRGTRGLGLYLVPRHLADGRRNTYRLRRLKEKLGTRSLATAEIEFNGAFAYQLGPPGEGFRLMMEEVLHLSRLCNSFCVCGMGRRAYQQADAYARHRQAFGQALWQAPLIREALARIRAENSALLSAAMDSARLQDRQDTAAPSPAEESDARLLLRLLVNLGKYLSACWTLRHVHSAIEILGGNGTIEDFSSLPRLLRDSIVCENWEGTHNTLRLQTLRDIRHYRIDRLFLVYIDTQLAALTAEPALLKPLQQARRRLQRQLSALATADAELQALLIRPVVDSMAILHCGSCLLAEGLQQRQTQHESAKLLQYRYFSLLWLTPEQHRYDAALLDLITSLGQPPAGRPPDTRQ